jgi:putative nucleotidyltransferase with HDIG domain
LRRDTGASRSDLPPELPDYHAVLCHAEELGHDEPSPPRVRLGVAENPRLAGVLAGILAGGIFTPAALLVVPATPAAILSALVLFASAGMVAAYAAYMVTRSGHKADAQSRIRHERNSIISTITSLVSALEARDPQTRNHSARVAKLAGRVGREMGLSQAELYEVHLGGLLHDVGKIGIPDSILLKPGGLTLEEYEIMKTHSALGARILAGIPGLERVAEIVHCHHEMHDGRGYPRGLQGHEVPPGARIIAVCDTYISMAENRPYRQGRSLEKVMQEIHRVAGRQLDPEAVSTLETLLRKEVETYGRPMEGFGGDSGGTDATQAA